MRWWGGVLLDIPTLALTISALNATLCFIDVTPTHQAPGGREGSPDKHLSRGPLLKAMNRPPTLLPPPALVQERPPLKKGNIYTSDEALRDAVIRQSVRAVIPDYRA